MSSRRVAILLTAGALLLTACYGSSGGGGGSGGGGSGGGSGSGGDGSDGPLPGCTPPSLAHCYAEATMKQYAAVVEPMIDQFFADTYAHMPTPSRLRLRPRGIDRTVAVPEPGRDDDPG